MQTWGENYWEMYAPVVNWFSVKMLLIIAIFHAFDTRAMNFVLTFPWADLDFDVFMELPYGFEATGGVQNRHILKLNKSLHDLKQVAYDWIQIFDGALRNRGFTTSNIDPCIYLRADYIFLV